jgi:hypothetical protein
MNEEKPERHTPLDADPMAFGVKAPPQDLPAASEREGIRKDLSEFEQVSADIQRKNLAATRVIAFVTALYMGFAALQWWTMRGQLAEMKSGGADTHALAAATGSYATEMKRLAEQTTSLAAYSKTSAEAAQRLEKSTNRTALQVGIDCQPVLSVAENPPIGKTWKIVLQIDNPYNRSASDVTVNAAAIMIDSTQTPNFHRNKQIIIKGIGIAREDSVRVPKMLDFVNLRTDRRIGPVTADLFDSIKSDRLRLFVYGEVTYTDNGGCHKQEFCRFFDPTMRTGGPNTAPTGNWMSCPAHFNESDCGQSDDHGQRQK